MIKVGINGFGRIGRFVFRAAMKRNDIQIVGINDLCPVDYLAYMLKYDTMHGQFDGTIEADVENSKLIVNGQAIRITAERNPADLKWNEVEAEYVVESTGLFLSKDKAQAHIEAGAKYVVMSAPSKDDTPMFVCGVNEKTYVKGTQFVSNASCTTNCLAPIAKVLNDKWWIYFLALIIILIWEPVEAAWQFTAPMVSNVQFIISKILHSGQNLNGM